MRRTKYNGRFFIVLLLNLFFNIEWSIPAWILLVLHYVFGMPIYWFFIALVLWIIAVIAYTKLISAGISAGNQKDPYRENKNPYSNKK